MFQYEGTIQANSLESIPYTFLGSTVSKRAYSHEATSPAAAAVRAAFCISDCIPAASFTVRLETNQ